jgi:RNA polymerase sigma factor for flagellar operon FliA
VEQKSRNEMIEQHMPLVKQIANKIVSRLPKGSVELEDLYSIGTIGLVSAVDSFVPEKKVPFPAYARYKIKGIIIDELRNMDFLSRKDREKKKSIDDYKKKMDRVGQKLDVGSVIEETGISTKDYFRLDGDFYDQKQVFDERYTESNTEEKPDSFQKTCYREVRDAMASLPERTQVVLGLYYFLDMSMKEVAQVVGISEAMVCIIHRDAIVALRAKFGLKRKAA